MLKTLPDAEPETSSSLLGMILFLFSGFRQRDPVGDPSFRGGRGPDWHNAVFTAVQHDDLHLPGQ